MIEEVIKNKKSDFIPVGWKSLKIGDFLSLEYGKALKEKDRNGGNVFVYGSNGLIGFHNKRLVEGPGVIVGRKGSAGEVTYCDRDFYPIDTAYFVKTDLNIKFVYYLLKNVDFKKIVGSSAVPGLNRNDVCSQKIKIPIEEKERNEITKILSSLDDKIELNRKINSNLEKIASLLFKQWFINTNEKGFKTIRLGDFFPIKTGKKDANIAIKNGKYPFFTCSQDILFTDNFSFDSSSILLAGNGDFNIKWYEGKFEAYQRTYVLTPYKKELLGFLYFLMDYFLDDITVGHRGSVIKFITKGMIEDFEVKIPIDKDFNNKAKFFYEIIQVINFYEKEIKNLSQIRDFLLPRLMNGKIRVKI
ncbi:MAG: restriction endonuclease subunit S [Candidatus Pacebacteria bacterium]|nr:restriction endonuclease subunit S [Candidatus Paceibacterota bacterium]